MSKRMVLVSMFLTVLMSLVGMSASAIDTSLLKSFLYQGSSYVPLKSTASFLGAPLRWDADTGQAILTYNGQDLAMTPNSRRATYAGRSVMLSSQPIVVNGVTYIPTQALSKYYNVPVTWNRTRSEMKIKGPSGWRTMRTSSRPPWHGGPPPWALAWGQRGHGTPGHPSYAKPSGKGKGNAWRQHRYVAPGNSGKVKANGSNKANQWSRHRYGAPGNSGKANGNGGGNGKANGNKNGR